MTAGALLWHALFALLLVALSALLTRLVLRRARIMDMPNARSSHRNPTPKSGGVAVVAAFIAGLAGIYSLGDRGVLQQPYFLGFVGAALLIAAVSFYDDVRHKPFVVKLAAQCLAALVAMACGVVLQQVALPGMGMVALGWCAYPLTFLWIVGLTNAFNFMDGLDGLAGGVGLIASLFFCGLAATLGSNSTYIASYSLAAGLLGFLFYNFPPARIFMGDVGSAFLGFTFAVLAIVAARYDGAHVPILAMPLLLLPFIYDTAFTFFRRLLRGEKVTDAHRSHLYQLHSQLGYSHLAVSRFYWALAVVQGAAAIWLVRGEARLLAFLPGLVLMAGYSYWVLRSAAKAGLLARST